MSDEVVSPGESPTPGAVGGTGPDQSSGGPHLANTPLAGLTVLDLSTTLAGAFAAQFLADAGYCVTAMSPIFDEHRRLAPVNQFSRSTTKADGGCLVGEHTDAVLRELGYDEDRIEDLRKRQVLV